MKYRLSLLSTLFILFATTALYAQGRTIRGTITDDVSGEPISFAQVVVKDTQIGTVADENGSYVLEGAPSAAFTLVVQRIGYLTREVNVDAGQNTVNLSLQVDYLQVEELVVTGRATETARINLPNAIETVQGEELQEIPQQTIDQALQGRVAGAIVARNNGSPGGGLQLNVRGSSSINAAAEPLYVVDGVIVSNVSIASGQNNITRAASGSNPSLTQDNMQNRIADINIEDIENIEILKGASAAAIYGSKASNGVVIITTRKGQPGRARVDLGFKGGFYDLANTLGFRNFETLEEAQSVFSGAEDFWEPGRTFEHEQLLAGRNDFSWEATGTVHGGAPDGLRYFGSGLWRDDAGIIGNTGFEKQSGRANITTTVGGRANIAVNTNLMHSFTERSISNNANSEAVSHYMVFPGTPNFIDLQQRSDGTFPVNSFVPGGVNPLQTAELLENGEDVWRLIGSANLDWSLIERAQHTLRIVAPFGVDWFNQDNRIFSPPALHFEDFDGFPGTAVQRNSRSINLNAGANGVWEYRSDGLGTFTTSVGLQYDLRDLRSNLTLGRALTAGKDKTDAATTTQITEKRRRIEDFGFYVQEEWLGMDDRLLLVGSVRFDQSSANGDPEKLFIYPKAAASYRIPDLELGFLDEVKLRAAFGQTGNQPLCDLQNGCQKFTSLRLDENIEGIPGLTIENTVGDPELQPERMTEIEAGIDINGFNGRGTLELTGYWQNITDLILQREIAESSGFDDLFFNGGTLRNYGFEAALAITPVLTPDFNWVSRTIFFLNRSELTDLPVPAFRTSSGFGLDLGQGFIMEGESITMLAGQDPDCLAFGKAVEGVSGENCLTGPEEGQTGLARNGDTNPDFSMGFTNDFTFGGFRLFTLFEWRQGMEIVNLTQLLYDIVGFNSADSPDDHNGGNLGVVERTPVKQCHPDCNAAERAEGFGVGGYALPYTQPGSFFKAREISLSYRLPESALRALFGGFFDAVTIRASGRDLFTITNYDGLDPEVSNFGNQQVGRSIDVAPFPPSRSFWLGIDVSL